MTITGYDHLCETFTHAERMHPDLMEPYSIRLGEPLDATTERMEIMRAGLRETIAKRYPMHEVREVVAVEPSRQGVLDV